MTHGTTAAFTLSFSGTTASNAGQEIDLATDAGLDLLATDSGGDVLLVQAGFVWIGGTAAVVVPERSEQLEGESWIGFSTETGSIIATEGS